MAYQTILFNQKSTNGSPYSNYIVEVEPGARTSESSIDVSIKITCWLNASNSFLGTGHTLNGILKIGASTFNITIKSSSESWQGTAQHEVTTSGVVSGLSENQTSISATFTVNNSYNSLVSTLNETVCSNLSISSYVPPAPTANTIITTSIPDFISGYDEDTFSLSTIPSGGSGYSYKWYKDGTVIGTLQNLTGTLSHNDWDNTKVYCLVSDETGGETTTNKCEVRVGLTSSKTPINTYQILPVKIYDGESFLDGIPFIKVDENNENKFVYCGWVIKEEKNELLLIDTILIFDKTEGKAQILSPKEVGSQLSFYFNYSSTGNGGMVFSNELIKKLELPLNYLQDSFCCLVIPKENFLRTEALMTTQNSSFGQLVPSEFSANTIWILPIIKKTISYCQKIGVKLNFLLKDVEILINSNRKGFLVKTLLEENKEELDLSFISTSNATKTCFESNFLQKDAKFSYSYRGRLSKILYINKIVNLRFSFLCSSTGRINKTFPKESSAKLDFSFLTSLKSHPRLLISGNKDHHKEAGLCLSLSPCQPILYQINWEYPQMIGDTISITQAFYVSVEDNTIIIN